ncbi:MAG: hypothetical protein GY850_26195 [bacterium]|nr:hypothetical protein [bacterium]
MSNEARDKVASLDFWSSAVEPEPLHGVMRFNEIAAARAAHAAGISPEIVYQAEGVFVMRFIEGHTLSKDDVRQQPNLARLEQAYKALQQMD